MAFMRMNLWNPDASELRPLRQHLLDELTGLGRSGAVATSLPWPSARLEAIGVGPSVPALMVSAATAGFPASAPAVSTAVTVPEPLLRTSSTLSQSGRKDAAPLPPPPIPVTISRGVQGWTQQRVDQLIADGTIKADWLPDMRAVAPMHLQIQNEHQREMLRFSNCIANTGANHLQVRRGQPLDPAVPADQRLIDYAVSLGLSPTEVAVTSQELLNSEGQLAAVVNDAALSEYHPAHRHFHIGETAGFRLDRWNDNAKSWDPLTGREVVKTTFCLIDVNKIQQVSPGNPDLYEVVKSPANQNLYNDCFADVQGIQKGWSDRYSLSLPGQEVDVTGLAAGVYRVVSIVNPSHWFIESNFENNIGWASFSLSRDSHGNPLLREIDGGVGGIWFQQSPNGMG